MRCERGQASVEWAGAVLVVAVALAALGAGAPAVDGRSFGGFLAHSIVCAVRGGCRGADGALVAAYGARDAALVRRYAPNIAYEPGTYTLPIDWRSCRSHRCSDAPDRADLDTHRSARGASPATAFTHVIHRAGRTYLQYWFYYPDSTTTWGGSAAIWNTAIAGKSSYPGYHDDDWEGYQVRLDPDGGTFERATSHHGYQYCKGSSPRCHDWGPRTGWTRVSRGSHAGHIPMVTRVEPSAIRHGPHSRLLVDRPAREGVDVHERTTTAAALRLVPLESIDARSYHPLQPDGPTPPWRKEVYADPASDSTG